MHSIDLSDRLPGLSPSGRCLRLVAVASAAAPVLGAFIYNTGFRVTWLVCPIRHFTGVPCPTCGMTRAFMALARGDLSAAWQHHALGGAVFLAFGVAIAHFSLELICNRPIRTRYTNWLSQSRHQLAIVLLLISYHGVRLWYWGLTGELQSAVLQSPLGQWLMG
jgi:hypothetical protein